jgi:hypothetical protein
MTHDVRRRRSVTSRTCRSNRGRISHFPRRCMSRKRSCACFTTGNCAARPRACRFDRFPRPVIVVILRFEERQHVLGTLSR